MTVVIHFGRYPSSWWEAGENGELYWDGDSLPVSMYCGALLSDGPPKNPARTCKRCLRKAIAEMERSAEQLAEIGVLPPGGFDEALKAYRLELASS